ncbi:MAG TPA: hypothetical protein PLW14_10160 [Chlorobiota bacterium]|nr:hypothetical protein [Chlorobiota bacterium]
MKKDYKDALSSLEAIIEKNHSAFDSHTRSQIAELLKLLRETDTPECKSVTENTASTTRKTQVFLQVLKIVVDVLRMVAE